AAVPPLYVTIIQLRMLGGYVETLVLGSALLLLAVMVADRWKVGESTRRLWVGIGFLVGFGLWIDPLIVYYIVAAALWLLPPASRRVRALQRSRKPWVYTGVATVSLMFLAALAGALPAVIYAIKNNFANLAALTVTDYPTMLMDRSRDRLRELDYLFT